MLLILIEQLHLKSYYFQEPVPTFGILQTHYTKAAANRFHSSKHHLKFKKSIKFIFQYKITSNKINSSLIRY